MAKLYLSGRNEPIELDEKQAIILKEDWVAGRLPEIVDLGSVSFNKRKISTILLFGENKEDNTFIAKMTTQEIKNELGDFLAEFDKHFTGVKAQYKGLLPIAARDEGIIQWAQVLEAIYYHDKPYPYWSIKDSEFADFSRKLELRNELNYRREYMKKIEENSMDSLVSAEPSDTAWKYEKDDSIPDQISEEQFNELREKRNAIIKSMDVDN